MHPFPLLHVHMRTETGVVGSTVTLFGPLAGFAARKGAPMGKIVGTVSEIRQAVKGWPLLAGMSDALGQLDARTQTDLWGLLYALLLLWPGIPTCC